MGVCISVGSTWLKELIWPFAISICLGTYWHMCVRGPVCVCLKVCGYCHGNLIEQLAAHDLFQVSVLVGGQIEQSVHSDTHK